ncbi:hypothetical protein HPB52_024481 [Rhipicephalus sanguineus]|uniref:Uncharacterized protein n=1 Tax=Rhipicephalus sanguineus TaxID=34632 RepID=A0A9D4TCD2_RHISA|nr:hypothetical protein HPB52_024481 [Rhipicephalus sanguineus]
MREAASRQWCDKDHREEIRSTAQQRRESDPWLASPRILPSPALPESVRSILDNGPKYSFEPVVPRHQPWQDEQPFARTFVNGTKPSAMPGINPPFKYIVDTLEKRSLALIQADKDRGFVVMAKGLFN